MNKNELTVSFTDWDLRNKLPPALFDMLVTRLADEYMKQHGQAILNTINKEELMAAVTEAVTERVNVEIIHKK